MYITPTVIIETLEHVLRIYSASADHKADIEKAAHQIYGEENPIKQFLKHKTIKDGYALAMACVYSEAAQRIFSNSRIARDPLVHEVLKPIVQRRLNFENLDWPIDEMTDNLELALVADSLRFVPFFNSVITDIRNEPQASTNIRSHWDAVDYGLVVVIAYPSTFGVAGQVMTSAQFSDLKSRSAGGPFRLHQYTSPDALGLWILVQHH